MKVFMIAASVGLLVNLPWASAVIASPQVNARLTQAHSLMSRNEFNSASGLLRAVLKENPANSDAHLYMGICLYRQGMVADALLHLKWRVAANAATALDHLYIGDCLFCSGELNGAIDAYSQALQLDNHLSDAYAGLAKSYVATGNLQHAETVRTRALQYGCRLSPQ